MKELNSLAELMKEADLEVLKQLIHHLANKDSSIKKECLCFLRGKVKTSPQVIIEANEEEMWALWDELETDLSGLDEYGGGPEEDEEHVSECLFQIEELLNEREIVREERAALAEEVLAFIRSGNAGMDDLLYGVVYATCKDPEDWVYLAEAFEKIGKDWPVEHARRIYRKIGEDEKYLELRARKMIYGLDYYDLVTFYIERGDEQKAIAVAKEGIARATGRMDELHEFMAVHC